MQWGESATPLCPHSPNRATVIRTPDHYGPRRPGAFGALAGECLRRVNAEFAVAGGFASGVIEHVRRLHFFTNGLRTLSCGKAEKSRSADHSSLAP
jgi:hypothetical protein